MQVLRASLALSPADAKLLLAKPPTRLCDGSLVRLEQIAKSLADVGAIASIHYDADEEGGNSAIPDSLSVDKKHCATCGAKLFFAVPGTTSKDEIRAFARQSKCPSAAEILNSGWIHPGVYCPNDCGQVLVNFGPW